MAVKYDSFEKLIMDMRSDGRTAFIYADDDDQLVSVTRAEFAEMVLARAQEARAECSAVEVILADHSVEVIADMFAKVIAGCDIILADPMVPESAAAAAALAAEAARLDKSRQRDARGRLITAHKEGEGEVLFFTSGTTSRSKIVRLTSKSLCTSAWSGQSMLACGEGDILLSVLPLSHVFGFVCALLWGLAYGATVALGRGVRHMVDDTLFFRPTIVPAVPSLIAAMLRFGTLNDEIRVALIGAAPCPAESAAALRERGIDVYMGYGLTETSSGIAITQDLDEPEALYPCPGADIRIEADGEVTVATPCMMQGYVGREPMFENGRFFTGDLGWFDEKGRLHLKGRKKDVLLMADGTKIFCPEYEEDLSRLSGIRDLAVVQKDGRAALLVAKGADLEAARRAMIEYNRDLARSQQIYEVIEAEGDLPRTPTGKLKRYEL